MERLPETLGAKLPETLEEATEFSAKDKLFNFLWRYRLFFIRSIYFVIGQGKSNEKKIEASDLPDKLLHLIICET